MLKRRTEAEADFTQEQVSLSTFLESYNKTLPADFSPATAGKLKEFQKAYPALFKRGNTWSIAQHRKRVMDWLYSGR